MMLMKSILHVLLSVASDIAYIVLYNECSGPEQLVLCTSLCVVSLPESDHGLSQVVGPLTVTRPLVQKAGGW